MIKKNTNGEDKDPQEVLALMQKHVMRALSVLDAYLDALEYGDPDPDAVTGTERAAIGARRAIQTLFEERKAVEKLGQATFASTGGGALDLDSARAEIRRRLDRLGAVGGAGGVPDGSE